MEILIIPLYPAWARYEIRSFIFIHRQNKNQHHGDAGKIGGKKLPDRTGVYNRVQHNIQMEKNSTNGKNVEIKGSILWVNGSGFAGDATCPALQLNLPESQ